MVYAAALDSDSILGASNAPRIIIEMLRGLAICNHELGRRDDELENLPEIYAKTEVAYGQDEETYAAALGLGKVLLEQFYVFDGFKVLHEVVTLATDDLGVGHELAIQIMHTYCRSLWMMHFYGRDGYRQMLRDAVGGLLMFCEELVKVGVGIEPTQEELRVGLSCQLDWSLDLDLNAGDKASVDSLLARPPAWCEKPGQY